MAETTTIEQQRWMELEEERRKKQEEKEHEMEVAEESDLTEEELEEIKYKAPAKPNTGIFLLILMLALTKDGIDISIGGADLGIIGAIFGIFAGAIIAIWMFGKGMFILKRLMRKIGFRLILLAIAAFIPVLNVLLPEVTIFVLMAHYRHTKVVRGIEATLKKLETLGIS